MKSCNPANLHIFRKYAHSLQKKNWSIWAHLRPGSTKYSCLDCDKVFSSKQDYNAHLKET